MFRHVPVAVQKRVLICLDTSMLLYKNCINMFWYVPVAAQGRYLCVQTRPCCCTKTVLICSDTFLCTKIVLICSDTSLLLYKNCINMFRHVPFAVQKLYWYVHTRHCCCKKTVLICSDTSLLLYKNCNNMFRQVTVAAKKTCINMFWHAPVAVQKLN